MFVGKMNREDFSIFSKYNLMFVLAKIIQYFQKENINFNFI